MEYRQEKVIELNKRNVAFLMLLALCFAGIGIWILSKNYNTPLINRILLYGAAVGSILLFGFFGIYYFKKIVEKSPALILNEDGFTDNVNGFSAVFISWADVARIEEYETEDLKSLSIYLEHPERYIKCENLFQRVINFLKHKFYGTPINFSSGILKISDDELKLIFDDYYANYRNKA